MQNTSRLNLYRNHPVKALIHSILTLVLSLGFVHAAGPDEKATPPESKPQFGINLSGISDFATELPFVDVFRLSRTWISQTKGKSWGKGPALELDENGWVKKLEPDCWAETILCNIQGGHYPSGKYTVFYEGEGELEFAIAASLVSSEPGKMTLDVDSSKGTIFLRLRATNPNNPVRNIRVIMPGFENSYKSNPFHPAFLKRWKGAACLRFMDWMDTNNSEISKWADRPTKKTSSYALHGVPLEVMIDLCNRQKADAWFCIPHLADDDYVRQFAAQVKEQLDENLKVHIEYSNEVWNGMFAQNKYSQKKGKEHSLGDAAMPWEGGGMYYSRRSVEIFKIWEKVYGSRDQHVRVLAWQAANSWWLENIVLPHDDAYKHADAMAIAPYVALNVSGQKKKGELHSDEVAKWSLDQVFEYLEAKEFKHSLKTIKDCRKIANQFGLKLMAYEGGQHMVGVLGGENNEQMEELFHKANLDPRMGEIYRRYFEAWSAAEGDLFCYFISIGEWSKWGSWGIMEYYDDKVEDNPKMQAVINWAKDCGQELSTSP